MFSRPSKKVDIDFLTDRILQDMNKTKSDDLTNMKKEETIIVKEKTKELEETEIKQNKQVRVFENEDDVFVDTIRGSKIKWLL